MEVRIVSFNLNDKEFFYREHSDLPYMFNVVVVVVAAAAAVAAVVAVHKA